MFLTINETFVWRYCHGEISGVMSCNYWYHPVPPSLSPDSVDSVYFNINYMSRRLLNSGRRKTWNVTIKAFDGFEKTVMISSAGCIYGMLTVGGRTGFDWVLSGTSCRLPVSRLYRWNLKYPLRLKVFMGFHYTKAECRYFIFRS